MISECLEIFEKTLEEDPNLILRNYIPKDGKYTLVVMKEDGDWEVSDTYTIEYDKKTKSLKNEPLNYSLIKYLDYNSNLLNMNKPIDNKKAIHSSNYYSFFFKESSYPEKLNKEAIERYFSILKNPLLKYKDKNSKNLYLENEENLGEVSVGEIEEIESWLIENIDSKFEIESSNNTYFKIFFVYEDEELTKKSYKREQDRYLLTNLFNKNKYNVEIDGKIYGVSNNNFGMNDKKPFLENIQRKVEQPMLIDADRANLQNLFFDYLSSLVKRGKNKLYFDTKKKIMRDEIEGSKGFIGFELFLYPDKNEAAILNYNYYTKEYSDIDIELIQFIDEIKSKNPKTEDIAKVNKKYGNIDNRIELMNRLDLAFFYNYYQRNKYNLEKLNIKEIDLKMIIIKYGKIVEDAILYNKYKALLKTIDDLIVDSITYSLSKEYNTKAITQFNYYLSLKEYFEKREGEFMDFQEKMKNKLLSDDDIKFENDDEALFALGQVLKVLENSSNMGDKNLTFIMNFVRNKKADTLKNNLERLLLNYAHNIKLGYRRFNNTVSKILTYEFDQKVTDDKPILAGFLGNNYFYTKKDRDDEESKEN